MTEYEQNQREETIAGLRAILETLEANPGLRAPYFGIGVLRCDSRDEMRDMVKAYGGKWTKQQDDNDFQMRRVFSGSLSVLIFASHEKVCKRVVTGKRVLPAEVIPAQPERILPEREEEIVQWVCPEVLSDWGAIRRRSKPPQPPRPQV